MSPKKTGSASAKSPSSRRTSSPRASRGSGASPRHEDPATGVSKIETHIPGFDLVADGGLPARRATLIAGTAGSAKTVFATHFLAAGIVEAREARVFVTFEDQPDDIRRNMHSFGWDIPAWERDGLRAFVGLQLGAERRAER